MSSVVMSQGTCGAVLGEMMRRAAARFGDNLSSAIRWMSDYPKEGRSAAEPRGGDQRSGRFEAQHDFLMAGVKEAPDITLAELRERLIVERGETFAISTIHQFFRHHGVSRRKTAHVSEQEKTLFLWNILDLN